MPTFVKYLNNIVLTLQPAADSAYHDVDVSLYGVSSDAKGIVVRAISAANGQDIGMRDTLDTNDRLNRLNTNFYAEAAISLNGGSTISLLRESTSVVFQVAGEFQDDCVLYSTAKRIPIVEAQFASWILRQPVPQGTDALSDIKAVIVSSPYNDAGADGVMGIRQNGSSMSTFDSHRTGDNMWYIVGVDDDGYYQVYSTGDGGTDDEHSVFLEVGYVLNASNIITILNPVDLALADTSGAYAELDLSASVPKHTITAGICFKNSSVAGGAAGHLMGFVRAAGSSQSVTYTEVGKGRSMTTSCTLNTARKAEYVNEDATGDVDTFLLWYERGMPSSVVTKPFAGPATGAAAFSGSATGAVAKMTQSCGGIAHMGSG